MSHGGRLIIEMTEIGEAGHQVSMEVPWRRDSWKKQFLSWVLYDEEKCPALTAPPRRCPPGRENSGAV